MRPPDSLEPDASGALRPPARLPETIVLSLPGETARRAHIARHFAEIGITDYRVADALPHDAGEVDAFYDAGRVAAFPPCFRCGREVCGCDNNVLIPQQVANALSFHRIWQSLSGRDPRTLFLLCEDDVLFYPGATQHLAELLDELPVPERPFLLRLARSGDDPDQRLGAGRLETTDRLVMSNPAYIINGAMAAHLVARFERVETTSDIWLHRDVASDPEVEALTVDPLIATELSFDARHARFPSGIHPKGITPEDAERARKHFKRVGSGAEYTRLRRNWTGRSRPVLKQWNYLSSPAFQMRYMLGAGLLRKFDNILEIGSYKTPIFRFLEEEGKRVRCLDPMIFESRSGAGQGSEMLDYRCLELDPFEGAPFALVILGLDLPITYKIKRYMTQAEAVVIEFPEDAQWKRSRETFDALVAELGLTVLARVRMDFDGNDFSAYSGPADWPPRTQRYVHLLSARHASADALAERNPFVEPMPELDTTNSQLIDSSFAAEAILPEAAFEFSHGAFGPASYLGGGLLYYTLAYMMRSRVCVCLGSGGAFVPRLMRQAQRDIGLAQHGRTILVDGDRGEYGRPNWLSEDSAFRSAYPEIDIRVADTAETANVLAEERTVIDYLHIDADHSREGCLRDFEAYLPLMRAGALVTLHDTRPNAHESTTCWQAVEDIRERGFELLDLPMLASGVAIIKIPDGVGTGT